MKLTITKPGKGLVYTVPDNASNAEILLTIIYDKKHTPTDQQLIRLVVDIHATADDVTTEFGKFEYEFIVACLRQKRLDTFTYLLENLHVSVNFTAKNGSPLMLFAIQQGFDSFRRVLDKNVILFSNGDFRKNNIKTHIDVEYCLQGWDTITQNAVFNIAFQSFHLITNVNTLVNLARIGIARGQPYTNVSCILAKIRRHPGDVRVTEDLAKDFVELLIKQKCIDSTVYQSVKSSLSLAAIKNCVYLAIQENACGVYSAMCTAFPESRIYI